MKKIHTLILIVALWSAIPGQAPFRALFDLTAQDTPVGEVIVTSDPEDDPIMITIPPPR